MKLKTILGVIACAGACASFSAFANTTNAWFSATPSGSTLTRVSVATKTNNVAVTDVELTFENDMIVLDAEKDEALQFVPTSAATMSDGLVTLSASAVLTPCDTNDLEEITGAKTGFAVGVAGSQTNFYGYVAGGWLAMTEAVPATVDTTAIAFKLELNYRDGKVKFFYDGAYLTNGGTNEFFLADTATSLAQVDVWGYGKIGIVSSSFENAVVAYDDKKYGSVAEALEAGGTMTTIDDINSSGEIVTPEAGSNPEAANGMPVAVCKALGLSTAAADAAVTVVPVEGDNDVNNVTLQLNPTDAANVEPGLVVKFAVKLNGTEVEDSPFVQNAIKVPCATGIYTVEPVTVAPANAN